MARRVSKTGHKSSKNHCTEISGVVLFFIVVILIVFLYVWFNTGPSNDFACAESETTPIENAVLQKDGSYLDRTGLVYPVGYYFRVNGTLRGCTCILKPCTRKCCNADGAISRETNKCVTNNDSSPFDLPNLKTYRMINSVPTEINVSRNHFTQLYGEVCQHGKFQLMPEYSPSDVSYLMTDGALYYLNTFQNTAQYCLDTFTDNSTIITLVCFPPDEDAPTTTTFRLYSSGMFISLPFLFLTFLVYSLLSELQNLHGKSLMCYVLTLFFAYLVLGIIQMYGNSLVHTCCVTFAFIVQFSFLASFFWLNVMCFDIWWVFSGLRPLRGSVKEREHKKFIIYSVYAWGWALAIFIVTLVMQTVESIPDTYVKPEFGVGKCWFRTDAATFWYFYFPIIILVVLNIIMFVTTAFQIRAHTRETEVLNRGESRRHDENEKQRYNLYLKLFIVMGVNWVNWELVSWIVGGEKKLWYVTDIAYTLQGVLIFLIFVWKRRILRLLNNKLCPKLQLVPMTTSSTRSKVNPSRTTTSSLKQTPSNNINTAPDSVSLKKMNSNV